LRERADRYSDLLRLPTGAQCHCGCSATRVGGDGSGGVDLAYDAIGEVRNKDIAGEVGGYLADLAQRCLSGGTIVAGVSLDTGAAKVVTVPLG